MSGLEVAALIIGGIQAGAGLISATQAMKEMKRGVSAPSCHRILLCVVADANVATQKSSSGPVYTYYKPKPSQQFVYINGEAEAYASKNGVYAKSTAGQAIAVWKSG